VEDIGYNEGYFFSVDHLVDYLDEEQGELEEGEEPLQINYAWTCREFPTCSLDLDYIIENACSEAHEGFDLYDLSGVTELRAAIEVFNKSNEDVVSWEPDMTVCVLLPRKEGA